MWFDCDVYLMHIIFFFPVCCVRDIFVCVCDCGCICVCVFDKSIHICAFAMRVQDIGRTVVGV